MTGILFSFVSGLLELGINSIVKSTKLDLDDVLFITSIVQMILAVIILTKKGNSIWIKIVDEDKNIHIIRIILISFAISRGLFFLTDLMAGLYLPLGDATVIIISSVVPTTICSAVFLNERFKIFKLTSVVVGMIGLFLVIRPPFIFGDDIEPSDGKRTHKIEHFSFEIKDYDSKMYDFGIIMALTCMGTICVFRMLMCFLLKNESTRSTEMLLLYQSIGCLMVSLSLIAFDGNRRIIFPSEQVKPYDSWSWLGLCIIVIAHTAMFFTRKMTMQLVGPVITGFARTSEIVISYLIQVVLFDTPLNFLSVIGAVLVMMVCVFIVLEDTFIQLLPPKLQKIF